MTWQGQAGLDEVSVGSAIVVAGSEEEARELIQQLRSDGVRAEEMSPLQVEAIQPPFVHIQKGELWGEPWSVELQFQCSLDPDQLSVLARRLARFEMTQPAQGAAVRSLRLSIPARDADEARARAVSLVRDALAGDQIDVRARRAVPVWVWERQTLDST